MNLQYAPSPIDNPLRGFVPFRGDYGLEGFPHSMEWAYFPLSAVMTGPSTFDFDSQFIVALDEIAERRHQSALRFYLDYPGKPSGVPQFLLDGGLSMHAYQDYGGGQSPDYADENLLIALEKFITEFGRRFDGDPRIACVTLGLLGFWGEWHTHPHDDWFPARDVQERILRSWTGAFSKTNLLMRTPQPNASKWSIGLHDDSFAFTTLGPEKWHFLPMLRANGAAELYRTQMIGGEVRPEIQPVVWQPPLTTEVPAEDFARCVAETHASWLINQQLFEAYPTLNKQQKKRALEAARPMGYELHVSQVEMPQAVNAAEAFEISISLGNRGVAPFYLDWPIVVRIDGQTFAAKDLRLSKVSPGQKSPTKWNITISPTADRPLTPGSHPVRMRAVPPLNNGLPLRFANEEQQPDGWLQLGDLRVR